MGIAFVKAIIFPYKEKPSVKQWLSDNFIDIIRGMIFTLVFTKLGPFSFEILQDQFDMSFNILDKLQEYNLDQDQLYLAVSIIFQGFLLTRK